MKDFKSALIQAADVIGHFAMNYMFMRLGHTSKNKILRGQLLVDTFGADVAAFDPADKATLSGDDFKLVQEGSFTFRTSVVITTPPKDATLMKDWPVDDGFLGTDRLSRSARN